MNLEQFAELYFANHDLGLKDSTKNCYYRPAARMFDRAVAVPVESLDKTAANKFVDWLRVQPKRPKTQHNRRRAFATLWTAAHEADLAPPPVPFRRIAVPKTSPVAWSFDRVKKIVDSVAGDRRNWINGIEYGTYWESLFSAAWDTALRLGDLLEIERDWIIRDTDGGGLLRKIQAKTQREHYVKFAPSTMAKIDLAMAQSPKRRLIWPLRTTRRRFYEHVKTILKKNDEPGTFRYFRRSSITFAEGQNPGAGQRIAGHQDSRTTRESYIDPMLLPKSITTVKPLG